MVAEFEINNRLLNEVAEIYHWLELQIRSNTARSGTCRACGQCCDFEDFDHRLFITPPELMYLSANIGAENIKSMPGSRCPYNIEGKCSVYEYRFAGCRIFCCKGSPDFQSELSETALRKFKNICEKFHIPYQYFDLPGGKNMQK